MAFAREGVDCVDARNEGQQMYYERGLDVVSFAVKLWSAAYLIL